MSISDERLAEIVAEVGQNSNHMLEHARFPGWWLEVHLALTELQSLRAAAEGDGEWGNNDTDESFAAGVQTMRDKAAPSLAGMDLEPMTPTDNLEAGAGDLVAVAWEFHYQGGPLVSNISAVAKRYREEGRPVEDLVRRSEAAAQLTAMTAERDDLAKEVEAAKNDIRGWMTTFVRENFPDVPQWEPLPDLLGMLSQMDNASTIARDYRAQLAAATAENARLRERIEQAYKAGFDFAMLTNSADADLAAENARLEANIKRLAANPADHRYWEGRYRSAETQLKAAREHIEQLSELLKIIKEHWIDYDQIYSISVHEADEFSAALSQEAPK